MSSHLKAELAATCSTLGRLHKGEYLIEPDCIESVKDLIRYLKRDDEAHEIRRYLGESKILQNDLIHIVKSCPEENSDLFDVTLRLLINLTTPALLFFGEEIPTEKIARNIYLSLVGYVQDYKVAFCDVAFWNKVCGKLTELFEIDWTERSADDGIQIERILMLLRNVLQVPADIESEKRPENDITVHDKVLWALRQSQILELLLFVSSSGNEEPYYLNLLEIFSVLLREQNPKLLARCDVQRSAAEKSRDSEELGRVRELEKKSRNKYLNMRNFNATFVVKGMKSLSNNDVVCHKSLDKVNQLEVSCQNKKVVRTRRNRIPVESERVERRSTFSVRLFLKEFCSEFLSCSFGHLMSVVKNKLDSGKSLANDESYYFWALKFFLDFAMASDSDADLIKDFLSTESFHFVQTSMENSFEHLAADKKKTVEWVRRIHLILKAYHSLLETLLWMDLSKNPLTRSISREVKSQIFYVVEYREMTLHLLLRYDPTKFSVSYLRDLIETTHLFVKLLEEYSKQTKLVVQKVKRKRSSKRSNKKEEVEVETAAEKWEKVKDDVYDTLCSGGTFPEIPPFDAALEIPIDDQKGRAMKRIQMLLHEGRIKDGIGLLRSARQVWPENEYFGAEGMTVEDETKALEEICLADLGSVEGGSVEKEESRVEVFEEGEENEEESEDEDRTQIVEQDFDIMEYKKRLVNKKVVEGCGILLKNYNKNSDHTNHCVIKLLHRIGWECCMPGLLFQASLFWTLLKIMRDTSKRYNEINTFTVNLVRKFRKHAAQSPVVFLELLFWKEHNVALEIQHGYQAYDEKPAKSGGRSKKKKSKDQTSDVEREDRLDVGREVKRKARKSKAGLDESDVNLEGNREERKKTRKRRTKKKEQADVRLDNFGEEESEVDTEAEGPRKSLGNVSRILFENNSESSGDESDQKSTKLDGEEKTESPQQLGSNVGEGEDHREEGKWRKISKTQKIHSKHKRHRIIDSSNEESDEEGDEGVGKTGNSSDQPSRRLGFPDSSDEEKERENGSKSSEVSLQVEKRTTGEEDCPRGKENTSDISGSSQTSNTSIKKRIRAEERNAGHFSEDSDGSERSKSKRVRYIGSDSEMENYESEEAGSMPSKLKRRRRLAVIDSDSDLDTNSFDEK